MRTIAAPILDDSNRYCFPTTAISRQFALWQESLKVYLRESAKPDTDGLQLSSVQTKSHDCEIHFYSCAARDIRSRVRFTTRDSVCPDHVFVALSTVRTALRVLADLAAAPNRNPKGLAF